MNAEKGKKREAVTQQLIDLTEARPELKVLLRKSIEAARRENPDRRTNPAQSLEEYYDYVDWASKALPWNTLRGVEADSVYARIDQGLNYFYFLNDRRLPELEGLCLYNNSLQYTEHYRQWLNDFVKNWGQFLSTPQSWDAKCYETVYEDARFGLQSDTYESPSNWNSFNDFFARRLHEPSKRPVEGEMAEDASALVSAPADSVPQGLWAIDRNSELITRGDGVEVKSRAFYSVEKLMGPRSRYKDRFAEGKLTHSFLDVHDYHRYHFPVSGTVREVNIIPQEVASGGVMVFDRTNGRYELDCREPGWQMIETRGCVVLETEQGGTVAVLPVGMSQVSSVNFERHVKVGAEVKRGDPMGYFLFGGSNIVMLFSRNCGFEMRAPMLPTGYAHLNACSLYGQMLGSEI